MNIYVGNLPYNTVEDDLRKLFEPFGRVASVAVIKDKFTGKSKGFGFVEMPSAQEAQNAIQQTNNKDFQGRNLRVNEARPRPEGGPRGNRCE